MKNKPVLAIDLDGTLMKNITGANYQEPMPNSVNVVKALYESYEIIIWTSRMYPERGKNIADIRKNIEAWLKKYEIPFDDITDRKVKALAYIDDRAIRFTGDWMDIKNYFLI